MAELEEQLRASQEQLRAGEEELRAKTRELEAAWARCSKLKTDMVLSLLRLLHRTFDKLRTKVMLFCMGFAWRPSRRSPCPTHPPSRKPEMLGLQLMTGGSLPRRHTLPQSPRIMRRRMLTLTPTPPPPPTPTPTPRRMRRRQRRPPPKVGLTHCACHLITVAHTDTSDGHPTDQCDSTSPMQSSGCTRRRPRCTGANLRMESSSLGIILVVSQPGWCFLMFYLDCMVCLCGQKSETLGDCTPCLLLLEYLLDFWPNFLWELCFTLCST